MILDINLHGDGRVAIDFGPHVDPTETEEVFSATDLADALGHPGVGSNVGGSLRAIHMVAAMLRRTSTLHPAVRDGLELVDDACQAAIATHLAVTMGELQDSSFTRAVRESKRILEGRAAPERRGTHVELSALQNDVIDQIDAHRARYEAAVGRERDEVVDDARSAVFAIVGRMPGAALTARCLATPLKKGGRPKVERPQGRRHNRAAKEKPRGYYEVFFDLLRQVGLDAGSPSALAKARERYRHSFDTQSR